MSDNIDVRDQTTSNAPAQLVDSKERKRQRERDRYALMTDKQRDERNQKHHETYKKNKSDFMLHARTKDITCIQIQPSATF